MSVVSSNTETAEYLLVFGNFIITWNHVEIGARSILGLMAGDSIATVILSHQAGNATMTDTIRLAADWNPYAKEHLVHFCKFMDTVRAYRNYYVHNLIGVLPDASTREPIGIVMSLNVKGKFALHEKALRLPELEGISADCESLRVYGDTLFNAMRDIPQDEEQIEFFASLDKPALPRNIEKHVRDPQAPSPQPQS